MCRHQSPWNGNITCSIITSCPRKLLWAGRIARLSMWMNVTKEWLGQDFCRISLWWCHQLRVLINMIYSPTDYQCICLSSSKHILRLFRLSYLLTSCNTHALCSTTQNLLPVTLFSQISWFFVDFPKQCLYWMLKNHSFTYRNR